MSIDLGSFEPGQFFQGNDSSVGSFELFPTLCIVDVLMFEEGLCPARRFREVLVAT